MQTVLKFSKYHGIGNDFILVDNRHARDPLVSSTTAARLCDRHTGVGADGVIMLMSSNCNSSCNSGSGSEVATNSPVGDYTMKIFNSDGSEPEMCGNGIRCLAQFIKDVGAPIVDDRVTIDTLAGPKRVSFGIQGPAADGSGSGSGSIQIQVREWE
jgi:diaminopimelate epimerase